MLSLDPLVFVGAALLGLFAALSWLTRQIHGKKSCIFAGRERVILTDQHTVQVVEIGGVRLLVGTGPSGAPSVLAELGEAPVDAQLQPQTRSWIEWLGRLGVESGR